MAHEQFDKTSSYLAAVAVSQNLYRLGLIDEADYLALETAFAAKFLPLFRYEKPCLLPTLPITQTGRRAEK